MTATLRSVLMTILLMTGEACRRGPPAPARPVEGDAVGHRVSAPRHVELDDLLREDLVVGVGQLDQDRVRPGGQRGDDYRVVTCVRPVPGGAVEGHVQVPE